MNHLFKVLVIGSVIVGSAFGGNRVTEEEALAFCRDVWFPRLVLGPGLTPAKVEEKLDALSLLYTANAQLTDPNNSDLFAKKTLKGTEDLRRYYRAVLTHYPEWKFEIRAVYPTKNGFVLHYTGKNAPPVTEFDGVDILEIQRGPDGTGVESFKIEKLEEFYDRLPFTKKAGTEADSE